MISLEQVAEAYYWYVSTNPNTLQEDKARQEFEFAFATFMVESLDDETLRGLKENAEARWLVEGKGEGRE